MRTLTPDHLTGQLVTVPKGPDGCGCMSYAAAEHVEHVEQVYREDWENGKAKTR